MKMPLTPPTNWCYTSHQMTYRFHRALLAHEKVLTTLDASRTEIRLAIQEWVKQSTRADVAKELGYSLGFIDALTGGKRHWGEFHWRDKK